MSTIERISNHPSQSPPHTPRGSLSLSVPSSPAPSPLAGGFRRGELQVISVPSSPIQPPSSGVKSVSSKDSKSKIDVKTNQVGFYCMGAAALTYVSAGFMLYLLRKRVWVYPLIIVKGFFGAGLGIFGYVLNENAKLETKKTPPSQKEGEFTSSFAAEKNQPVAIKEYTSFIPYLISFFQCFMNMPGMQKSIQQHIVTAKQIIGYFEKYYAGNNEKVSVDTDCILFVLASDDQLIEQFQNIPDLQKLVILLQGFKNAMDQHIPLPEYEVQHIKPALSLLISKKYKYLLDRLRKALNLEKKGLEALERASQKYKKLQSIQDGDKEKLEGLKIPGDQLGKKQTFQTELTWKMSYDAPLSDFNEFLKSLSVGDDPAELINCLLRRRYGLITNDLFFEKKSGNALGVEAQRPKEWSSYLSLDPHILEKADISAWISTILDKIIATPPHLILKLDRYSGVQPNESPIIMPDTFELKGTQYRKKCFIMREPHRNQEFSAYVKKEEAWWYCCDTDIQSIPSPTRDEIGYLYFYEKVP